MGFTLLFMGADPAADSRQAAALGDNLAGLAEIALGDAGYEAGNVIFNRAAGAA